MVALLVVFTILLFLTADYLVTTRRRQVAVAVEEEPAGDITAVPMPDLATSALKGARLDEMPEGTFVSQGHVWARPESGGALRLGVDRLLVALLGGLEWLYALPEGAVVQRGGPLAMLRKGDRALKLRSPVDGVVSAVNRRISDHPGDLPSDPFGQGWIYEVTPKKGADPLKDLPFGEKASRWMRDEVNRLLDLVFRLSDKRAAQPILPDGGVPLDSLGTEIESGFNDEEWEDLIASFFGHSRAEGRGRVDS
jgi:glycine cleavage system H protein